MHLSTYIIKTYFRDMFKNSILVAQMVKNLPSMLETPVQSPGQEDPLGSSCNPLQYSRLEIPWTEEPGGLQGGGQVTLSLSKELVSS